MLFNTGLILQCKNVNELLFVMGHEIGHHKNQHFLARMDVIKRGTGAALAAWGLGVLVAILTKQPEVAALGHLGQNIGTHSILSFSREQESSADMLAFKLLKQLNWPSDGSLSLFQKLKQNETGYLYAQTHPLSSERLKTAEIQSTAQGTLPPSFLEHFKTLRTKIWAYTVLPSEGARTIERQPNIDKPYALAILAYRQRRYAEALAQLGAATRNNAPNPYLQLFKAEILFEMGNFQDSERALQSVMNKLPTARAALQMLQARILIAQKKNLDVALSALHTAQRLEPDNPEPWYWAAIAYGLQEERAEAALALAEKHFRLHDLKKAKAQAQRARSALQPAHSPTFALRLSDFEKALQIAEEERCASSGFGLRGAPCTHFQPNRCPHKE